MKDKITIVSSTNRIGAYTRKVAGIYAGILKEKGAECSVLDLRDLPADFIFSALFENRTLNPEWNEVQKRVDAGHKFVFIVPEYNGSFPGILKAFLDGLQYPDSLRNKVGALVGLSSGTMGGALALSHLTDILHYFGMHVLPIKPRLGGIAKSMHEDKFTVPLYYQLLESQAEQLLGFNVQ